MNKTLALAALLVLATLAGCGAQIEETDESESVGNTTMTQVSDRPNGVGVFRFTDSEAGVTCWVYSDAGSQAGQGGLSCLLTNETDL